MPQFQQVNSTATISLGVLSIDHHVGAVPMLFMMVYVTNIY